MRLHVVAINYATGQPAPGDSRAVAAYRDSGVYQEFAGAAGELTVGEPVVPADRLGDDPIANLGAICGALAGAVATGLRDGARVLIVGGDCSHLPGVLGGFAEAFGPVARTGLVWFDAHGDFNTPRTTPSGMLGGMPVAVSAGLCHGAWREGARQYAPLPTDRIVMVDVRNLDPEEERLIRATDVTIARVAPGFHGDTDLAPAIDALAARCDRLYLHVDSDILDASLTPSHRTKEPAGPTVAQTLDAIGTVLATGKVAALGLLSVNPEGPGGDVSLASALALLRGSLRRWERR